MSVSLYAFKRNRRTIKWSCVVLLVLFICLIGVSVYSISQGGLTSEQLIGRSGVSDSNLVINHSGTNGALDIGFSGIIVSSWVTDIDLNEATLHADLSDLNGMPSSEVYFQWGYSGAVFPNETSHQIVSVVGNFEDDIVFDPTQTVYFRAVTEIDGVSYGPTVSFDSLPPTYGASSKAISWYLLWYTTPLILIVMCLAGVFSIRKVTAESVIVVVMVVVFILIIRAILVAGVS